MLRQLRELNVNLLLDPAQRQLKRQFLLEGRAGSLAARLEAAIQAQDLPQAQALLEELVGISPDQPRLADLRPRLEQLSRQERQRQLEEARRRVADVMAVGDFAQAEVLSQRLLERQSDWPEARQLQEHVRRERQLYLGEQRTRMVRLVEREVADRHWRGALQAARELIAAFPDSAEAQSVRGQLETLAENAALEEARELRDQIRGLFEHRQYRQALELARDLVARFPATAAAEGLRRQMGRLEELALAPEPPKDQT
jgi:tetratricopeptide (TPR) repeat protein